MRNKFQANHVLYRDGVCYYVRRVPYGLTSHHNFKRLCFSLRINSATVAIRASKSISQRLEDYRLGLRLQNMDIPVIQVIIASDETNDATLCLSKACDLYPRQTGVSKDKMLIRTANRNTGYATTLLGDRHISSRSSNGAIRWCFYLEGMQKSLSYRMKVED